MYFKNHAVPDKARTQKNYKEVLKRLEENVISLECYKNRPVLSTGKGYPGIWLEHNHDSLFYADINPEAAKNSHRIFYDFQSEDGLFPAYICKWEHEEAYRIGYGHLQTVYPLAASAFEIAKKMGDEEFLADSYCACKKYDEWIGRWRNTTGRGLAEVFCGFDTGHDNSSRIKAFPKICPKGDARICACDDTLPIIAPDLSAMLYRFKEALGDMADALGKIGEAEKYRRSAQGIKEKITTVCYDEEDEFYYDVDKNGHFRKYLTEHIFRLFVNHAVSQEKFEKIFTRYIMNPAHFRSDYPFASVSVTAPYFDISLKENNWNGKTQMHTVLETVFWMEYYKKADVFREYMEFWVSCCNEKGLRFNQEADPFTGEFSEKAPYFTTTLIMYKEFAERLELV